VTPSQVVGLFQDAFKQESLTTTSLLVGFAGAFLAFSGLESISQLSPVMKAPRKKVISIALLLVVLTIGFTSPLLTTLSTLLQPEAAKDEVLATQLISLLGGNWGHTLIQQEVAISASLILIFAGNTAIIGAYHVFLALARMDFLPSFILRRNRIRNTPHYSIILATGIPIAVLLMAQGQINLLGDMYAFGLLGAFFLTCLGLDIIRARERKEAKEDAARPADQRGTSLELFPPIKSGALPAVKTPAVPAPFQQLRTQLASLWGRLDFWLGIVTTLLVLLAWIVGLFSKPIGTAFGGSVVLLGVTVAIVNFIRQGRTLVLPMRLERRQPDCVLAVLMGSGRHNESVIESALHEAVHTQPIVFLYLSEHQVERTPRPFEIVDPYLEDLDAKETFRQAERLARKEGVNRRFVYQAATPEKLAQVWRFIQPRDVVIPMELIEQTHEINPDRLRYEVTPNGKVAHLVKHW
jgi:amino acid transporter